MTMATGSETITITIRKRPMWTWALAVLWACVEILLVQTAWASLGEDEYRAGAICGIAAAVLAAAGVWGWIRLR